MKSFPDPQTVALFPSFLIAKHFKMPKNCTWNIADLCVYLSVLLLVILLFPGLNPLASLIRTLMMEAHVRRVILSAEQVVTESYPKEIILCIIELGKAMTLIIIGRLVGDCRSLGF